MRKTPRQTRSRDMVDRIIEAAIDVLNEQGIDQFGTRQVADKAGISVGSLYQYYEHKQALLQAMGHRLSSLVEQQVIDIIPNLKGASAAEAIRIIVVKVFELLQANNGRYLALLPHWHLLDISDDVRHIEQRVFQAVLLQATRDPSLRGIEHLPRSLYIALNSLVFNLLRYASEPNPLFSREDLIEGLVEIHGGHLQRQLQAST